IDLLDGGRYKTALRCSKDLLHWSARMLVISDAADFSSSTMNYPVFLSRDGFSNTVIDADDFYVVGTCPGKRVNSTVYKLHLTAPAGAGPMMGAMTMVSSSLSGPDDYVRCYPNPCAGVCTLALGRASGDVTIGIFDMQGRRVAGTQWSGLLAGPISQNLDLSTCAPGIYVIKVWNSGTVSTVKVVRD
ncbi:MAG TPA: T9SS type A sorting domain-containing protein, partial [Puia sp.]|nr:T9SS type A sorting domain-containing protein [Puia sp.]